MEEIKNQFAKECDTDILFGKRTMQFQIKITQLGIIAYDTKNKKFVNAENFIK